MINSTPLKIKKYKKPVKKLAGIMLVVIVGIISISNVITLLLIATFSGRLSDSPLILGGLLLILTVNFALSIYKMLKGQVLYSLALSIAPSLIGAVTQLRNSGGGLIPWLALVYFIYTHLYKRKHTQKKHFIFYFLSIIIVLISIPQLLILFLFSSGGGSLNTVSAERLLPLFLASIVIYGLSFLSMWKGRIWNSLALQILPLLIWKVMDIALKAPYFELVLWIMLMYLIHTYLSKRELSRQS